MQVVFAGGNRQRDSPGTTNTSFEISLLHDETNIHSRVTQAQQFFTSHSP